MAGAKEEEGNGEGKERMTQRTVRQPEGRMGQK